MAENALVSLINRINEDKGSVEDDSLTVMRSSTRLTSTMTRQALFDPTKQGLPLASRGGLAYQRSYTLDDDPRSIDWNASARSEELIVRIERYIENARSQACHVILDAALLTLNPLKSAEIVQNAVKALKTQGAAPLLGVFFREHGLAYFEAKEVDQLCNLKETSGIRAFTTTLGKRLNAVLDNTHGFCETPCGLSTHSDLLKDRMNRDSTPAFYLIICLSKNVPETEREYAAYAKKRKVTFSVVEVDKFIP